MWYIYSIDNRGVNTMNDILNKLENQANFNLTVCDDLKNIDDNPKFKKVKLSPSQKIQFSSLASQLPAIMSVGQLADISKLPQLYKLSFPAGVDGTLMALKQGGFSTTLFGDNGKIIGTSSMYPVAIQTHTMVLGTVTAMSVVSGQYFLAQINSQLRQINQGMDKILNFLYGDKKAELTAEISFVKNACQNYNAIMGNDNQVVATIIGLQQAQKIAMKDCEFYKDDLKRTVRNKSGNDIITISKDALQIAESLETALQLYVVSNILEIQYSQNYNEDYLNYLNKHISDYIERSYTELASDFSALYSSMRNQGTWFKKDTTSLEEPVYQKMELFKDTAKSELKSVFHSALENLTKPSEYYIDKDGNVYLKN